MGDSGGCALSRRTRTKRASSSSSGSVDGAGAEWCRVGGGGRPVIVVCRSLRKDDNGDSAVLIKCPCRISCEPNTAFAGENLLYSLKEALMPSITQGRWSCQSAAGLQGVLQPPVELLDQSV